METFRVLVEPAKPQPQPQPQMPALVPAQNTMNAEPHRLGGTESEPIGPRLTQRRATITSVSSRYSEGEAPEIHHLQEPEWSWGIFFRIMLYHFFAPISLPFAIMIDGKHLVYNTGLIFRKRAVSMFFQKNVVQLCFLISMSLYLWAFITEKHTNVYSFEMIGLLAVAIWRLTVVAIKYAYILTSPYWSEKLLKQRLTTEEMLSLDVVAWLTPTPQIVHREIGIAAERIGERPETRYFAHAADAAGILRVRDIGPTDDATFVDRLVTRPNDAPFMRADSSILELTPKTFSNFERTVTVSSTTAFDFVSCTVLKAATLPVPGLLHVPVVLLFCLLPYIFRFIDGVYLVTTLDTVVLVTAFIPMFVCFHLFIKFLLVCYADYQRRAMCLLALTISINDNFRDHALFVLKKKASHKKAEDFIRGLNLPEIDMTVPCNISTWLLLLNIFHVYGAEFRKRIEAYNTAAVATLVLVVIGISVHFLAMKLDYRYFLYLSAFAFSVTAFMIQMAARAVDANAQYILQVEALLGMKLRMLRAKVFHPQSSPTHRRLSDCCELIDTVVASIKVHQASSPVTILGVTATPMTLRALIGIAISAAAFILQSLLRS